MKQAPSTLFILFFVTLLLSCKGDQNKSDTTSENTNLAVTDAPTETGYVYVTAPSGLTLREFNNLKSEKLAVMPYGTKLKVIAHEENITMTVGGIEGGMDEVEYNNKTGFAFNGFVSKFFPPEKGSSAKQYIQDIKSTFPTASYKEATGGTASKPTNTETIEVPTTQWHEAFYIAQQLYGIPKNFDFPNPKGNDTETISNSKKPEQILTSEMVVARKNNVLQKITYSQAAEGYGSSVTITKEENKMKIEYSAVAE